MSAARHCERSEAIQPFRLVDGTRFANERGATGIGVP
jgi:hypothetical protein